MALSSRISSLSKGYAHRSIRRLNAAYVLFQAGQERWTRTLSIQMMSVNVLLRIFDSHKIPRQKFILNRDAEHAGAPVQQGPPNRLFELGGREARGRTKAGDKRETAHAGPTPVRGGRVPAGIEGKQSERALLDPDAAGSLGKHACSSARLVASTFSHPLPGGCRFGGLFMAQLGVTQMPR